MSHMIVEVEQANEVNHCPICIGPIVQPTSLDCQSHTFCFKCIVTAMQRERNCPLCRGTVSFLKDSNNLYSLTVLDPDNIDTSSDIEAEINDIRGTVRELTRRRRPNEEHVPDVRTMLNPFRPRWSRVLAGSWFALVVSFWSSVLIFAHEILDSYCWKSSAGKAFALSLITILIVLSQRVILDVSMMRTRNLAKDAALSLIVFMLQGMDLIVYFGGSQTCYGCAWMYYTIRFGWVAIVLGVSVIDNPIA